MKYQRIIRAAERLFWPYETSVLKPHKNIKWISYHIPKTAGSSLRLGFEKALPFNQVYAAYEPSQARKLSVGKPVWIPPRSCLIQGHFKPHISHTKMFPNASTIVWVRDPIERIFSLVRHLLQVRERHPHYLLLKETYGDFVEDDMNMVVTDMILNNTLPMFTRAYARFFCKIPIEQIDFVGSVHNYGADLSRLAVRMRLPLEEYRQNVRNSDNHSRRQHSLKSALSEEYDIVERYL